MAEVNGVATSAEKMANSVWLILLARAFAVIGPAVAAFFFYLVWDGVEQLKTKVQTLSEAVAVQTVQIKYLEQQLTNSNGLKRAAHRPSETAPPD